MNEKMQQGEDRKDQDLAGLLIFEKLCGRCKEIKPFSEFHVSKTRKYGVRWDCKECVKKYYDKNYNREYNRKKRIAGNNKKRDYTKYKESRKKWKDANKEKMREYRKKWKDANKEKMREYERAYRNKRTGKETEKRKLLTLDEKKERDRIYRKIWESNNPEKIKERNKNKWLKHPETVRSNARNRRARKRNAKGSHSAKDIKKILKLQKNKCAICKIDITTNRHVDHIIPLAKGGANDIGNLQLLCPGCNIRKGTNDPIEFMQSKGFLI